jgi:quercetin dioxygenase-like cupin family protein
MDLVFQSSTLPGSDEARDFVGGEHGAGLTLILVDAPPGHGPALHRHPYEEIFVVHSGSGTFFVDGPGCRRRPKTSSLRRLERLIASSTQAATTCG